MADIQTTMQFQADVTDFKGAMQEANRAIKLANSQFAAASSGMEDWSKSTEGLQAKLQQLTDVQAAQQQKMAVLRAEYERVVAEQGENSRAAQELAIKINQQQAAINKTESEIRKYTGKLEEAEQATDDLADASDDAGDKADDMTDDLGDAEDAAEKLADASDKAASIVTGAFAAIGAACAAVVAGFLAMAESSREYRVAMGKVATAFEDVGMSADMGKELYQDFYAVLGDQDKAVEAISNLALLTNDQKALSEWTTIATGVYAKFGDALPIESLTEAANETARTGELTGGLADAINWGAKAGETFGVTLKANTKENEAWNKAVQEATTAEEFFALALQDCSTQAEREALIRETLNGLYGEAGEQYREVNGDIIASNEAQAKLTEAMAQLGAKAEPIMTAIKSGFAEIALAAASILENVDFAAITAAIENAFAWFIDSALPAITSGITWVMENGDLIIGIITAIGVGMAAWKVASIVTSATAAIKSMTEALKAAATGQKALNGAMKANIIGLVVTAVMLLVEAFIYLWNNCEGFRNFFIGMWEGIKKAFSATVEWFKGAAASIGQFFSNAWAKIKSVWDGSTIKKYFGQIWNTIKGIFSAVKSVLSGNFSDAWASIKGIFSGWGSFFSGLWDKVKGIFAGVGEWFVSVGDNIVSGIWSGISNGYNWIKNKITGWVGDVLGFFKNLLGIESPSKVMRDEVGEMMGLGMAEGITGSRAAVNDAVQQLSDAAVSGLANPSGSGAAAAGKSIVFNQYNNSPKALTRRDIYRQTFNALSYAGGV